MSLTDPHAARDALTRREGIRHGRVRERRYLGRCSGFIAAFFAAVGIVAYLLTRRVEVLLMFMGGGGAHLGNALWFLVIEPVPQIVREGGDPE